MNPHFSDMLSALSAEDVESVIEEPFETTHDLVSAAQSSLDFWDNPYDNEDWKNAGCQ